jgi:hypothetical protein
LAVYNTHTAPHAQHFHGLSNDQKPSGSIGDKFYEIDTGLEHIYNGNSWVLKSNIQTKLDELKVLITSIKDTDGIKKISEPYVQLPAFISGTTTENGTATSLIDSSRDFEVDSLIDKLIKFTINDVEYVRKIVSNTDIRIDFSETSPTFSAFATIGTGLESQGQVSIEVTEGTGGNYTVQFIEGTGAPSAGRADYDTETGLLTIVSPTDEYSNSIGVSPESLQGIINANGDANGIFTVTVIVSDYTLPVETNILTFTDDEMIVGNGLPTQGQVTVFCKGEIDGAVGNNYSIQIVQGEGITGNNFAVLDADTKTLTITVDLTGDSEPRNIGSGDLQSLLANTGEISDKFFVANNFVPGLLPIGDEPVSFIGGIDSIIVPNSTTYHVLDYNKTELDNIITYLDDIITLTTSINNKIPISQRLGDQLLCDAGGLTVTRNGGTAYTYAIDVAYFTRKTFLINVVDAPVTINVEVSDDISFTNAYEIPNTYYESSLSVGKHATALPEMQCSYIRLKITNNDTDNDATITGVWQLKEV